MNITQAQLRYDNMLPDEGEEIPSRYLEQAQENIARDYNEEDILPFMVLDEAYRLWQYDRIAYAETLAELREGR